MYYWPWALLNYYAKITWFDINTYWKFILQYKFSELEEDENDNLEHKHEQSERDKYLDNIELDHNDGPHKPDTTSDKDQHKRVKRQSDYEYTPTKTRCPLLLVADYRFFQEMGASNTKTTISYLVRAQV